MSINSPEAEPEAEVDAERDAGGRAANEGEAPDGSGVVGLVDGADTGADAGRRALGASGWLARLGPGAPAVVVGGLAGALAAIAAVFLLSELRPPQDPRVEPLARHLGTFTERMNNHESGLRAVEVDLVRGLKGQGEVRAEVSRQNAAIATALSEVRAVKARVAAARGPGSSVFGVAVVQLGDGIARGRPFEAEWVNLFALTAGPGEMEVALRRRLGALLPIARTGAPTMVALRRDLRSGAGEVGLGLARPNNILWLAADYLQTQLGLPLGTSPAAQAAEAALTEADRRLSRGDVAGAIELVADLGLPYGEAFEAWLAAAERRRLADAVTLEFRAVARREIARRARQRAAEGGAPPPSMTR